MDCAFQDYEHLYLVCDLMIGGDLRYYMKNPDKFEITEEKTSKLNRIYNCMLNFGVGIFAFDGSNT